MTKPPPLDEHTFRMCPSKYSFNRARLLEWALRRLLKRHTVRRRVDAMQALAEPWRETA